MTCSVADPLPDKGASPPAATGLAHEAKVDHVLDHPHDVARIR